MSQGRVELEQLERILESAQLAGAPSLCRLLRFLVEETLLGRAAGLREHTLGVRVFGRGARFEPRLDAIVRVQAYNLRLRLAQYYDGPGARDPVRIALPKGSYVPVFHMVVERERETASRRIGPWGILGG